VQLKFPNDAEIVPQSNFLIFGGTFMIGMEVLPCEVFLNLRKSGVINISEESLEFGFPEVVIFELIGLVVAVGGHGFIINNNRKLLLSKMTSF
jgi:hypothetical protein